VISSVMPSAKYSSSGDPLRFSMGRTAIEGRSSSARPPAAAACAATAADPVVSTGATKRKPRPWTVRITCWARPLSPTAWRAALMRLVKVASETIRPCHTLS